MHFRRSEFSGQPRLPCCCVVISRPENAFQLQISAFARASAHGSYVRRPKGAIGDVRRTESYAMKIELLPFLLCCSLAGAGQTDTSQVVELTEVVVSAPTLSTVELSTLNSARIDLDLAERFGSYSLPELLARSPGVEQLSTGPGITKPVIRGLSGNRILVLLAGLRFDAQQWQEEHGLGLSTIGLQGVEIVKGPAGVLDGTEAIGGVVQLVEEGPPPTGETAGEVGLQFHTNTLGGAVQAGLKKATQDHWWRLRVGITNHADYADGNGQRVLNSRFDGYALKATYGFQRKNWTSTNHFFSTFDRYGFVFNDLYNFIEADERWSRQLSEFPAHLVLLNTFASENEFQWNERSKLEVRLGVQSNERMENEGGGAISLNMHLLTVQCRLQYERTLDSRNKLVFSTLGAFSDNTNYGARKIVPDAQLGELNLSAYWQYRAGDRVVLENGLGLGGKSVHTFFTPTVNGPDKELAPFRKSAPFYHVFSGLRWSPGKRWDLWANVASGVRMANLAELSSDGLHEGVFTYEIGDPGLKNEQLLAADLQLRYAAGALRLSVSPFYRYFLDYIYLSPTEEEWFGFPVYRFRQQDARQYGAEAEATVDLLSGLQGRVSYAGMISKTGDGRYTPFLPAQEVEAGLEYRFQAGRQLPLSAFATVEQHLKQDRTAPFEIQTPYYLLLHSGISGRFPLGGTTCEFGLAVHNLLDRAYYDHLSRFKYFGLLNAGRNISLQFKCRY